MVIGLGTPEAALAGVAMLLAHALFKARPVPRRRASSTTAPGPATCGSCPALRLATPALAVRRGARRRVDGRAAAAARLRREGSGVRGLLHGGSDRAGPWCSAVLVLGSVLTVAYSVRFLWGAFASQARHAEPTAFGRSTAFLAAPALLAVLASAGLVAPAAGWLGGLHPARTPSSSGTAPRPTPGHLALWHGLTRRWGSPPSRSPPGLALFYGRIAAGPAAGAGAGCRRRPGLRVGDRAGSTGSPSRSPAATQRGSLLVVPRRHPAGVRPAAARPLLAAALAGSGSRHGTPLAAAAGALRR